MNSIRNICWVNLLLIKPIYTMQQMVYGAHLYLKRNAINTTLCSLLVIGYPSGINYKQTAQSHQFILVFIRLRILLLLTESAAILIFFIIRQSLLRTPNHHPVSWMCVKIRGVIGGQVPCTSEIVKLEF